MLCSSRPDIVRRFDGHDVRVIINDVAKFIQQNIVETAECQRRSSLLADALSEQQTAGGTVGDVGGRRTRRPARLPRRRTKPKINPARFLGDRRPTVLDGEGDRKSASQVAGQAVAAVDAEPRYPCTKRRRPKCVININ